MTGMSELKFDNDMYMIKYKGAQETYIHPCSSFDFGSTFKISEEQFVEKDRL